MKAPGGEDRCQRFKFFGQNWRRCLRWKLSENFIQLGGKTLILLKQLHVVIITIESYKKQSMNSTVAISKFRLQKFRATPPQSVFEKYFFLFQLLLIKTSEQLHSVTSGRLTIDHVDIQLPDAWSRSATCVQTRTVATSASTKKSSDFSVVKSSRQNLPWALQYGENLSSSQWPKLLM